MARQSRLHRLLRSTGAAFAAACVLAIGVSSAAQSLETLVNFQCSTIGCAPNAVFLQARDGFFYGTTSEGGESSDEGTVFRMDRAGGVLTLLSPARFFFEASDGLFYGTTTDGGTFGRGTIYRMNATGAVTDLYSFDGQTAAAPGPMIQTSNGLFYGIAEIPSTDQVTLFRMDADANVTLLRVRGDSIRNVRMLLAARNHFLYGTTFNGQVFRMNRNGQTRVLQAFPSVYVDLMEASDGFFYGTTIDGGARSAGMLFRMTRAGKVQVLHSFGGASDGANPYQAPIEGRDGNFYGTTGFGGAFGLGTIYRMSRTGVVTILHSFGGTPDAGQSPISEMVQGSDGALYGTTVFGGEFAQGTAFRLTLGR